MRVIAISCLFLLAGCASNAGSGAALPRVQLGNEFSLALGDSVSLDGTEYSIGFQQVIEDSRCAIGVTCVWEGNARIEIEMREWKSYQSPGGKREVVVFHFPVELNTSARFPTARNDLGFIVELRRLEPTPRADTPTTGYVATLFARKP